MEEKSETIEFSATLPPIQSAVSVGADQSRIKLDIPETDIAAVLKLAAYGRGKVLQVSVKIDDSEG